MNDSNLRDLLRSYKNFVFIGEAGSGKTEFGLNLAAAMARHGEKAIHFFDLDQTKPLFRARDVSAVMERYGVTVHAQTQFQDIPSMVPGIIESLSNEEQYTLLDIGGNVHGALMAGQLAACTNRPDTCVFFIINVYRPWSGNAQHIAETRAAIMAACRVASVRMLSNPTLGPSTTPEEVIEGNARLSELLGDVGIDYICVSEELCDRIGDPGKRIIPIHPYITMPG